MLARKSIFAKPSITQPRKCAWGAAERIAIAILSVYIIPHYRQNIKQKCKYNLWIFCRKRQLSFDIICTIKSDTRESKKKLSPSVRAKITAKACMESSCERRMEQEGREREVCGYLPFGERVAPCRSLAWTLGDVHYLSTFLDFSKEMC